MGNRGADEGSIRSSSTAGTSLKRRPVRLIYGHVWTRTASLLAATLLGLTTGGETERELSNARQIEEGIEAIRSEDPRGQTYRFHQRAVNDYLKDEIRRKAPRGLKGIELALDEGAFRARVDMNMDEIDTSRLTGGWLVSALLSGKRRLEVAGSFVGRESRGHLKIHSAWLGSVPMPVSLVNSLIRNAAKKANPPFDPTRPFDLPHGIHTVDLRVEALVVRN